jgi:uncharacterized protein YndB with AHSA1/START domain
MNESLGAVDGRNIVRIERWFRHPVEKVWRSITDPAEIHHWFPSDIAMDFRAGGTIHFIFRNGEGEQLEGRIIELDPPDVFTFLWGDSVLRFELRAEAGPEGEPGCRLLFSHTFDDRVSAASYAAGWHICFDSLYLLMDGHPSDVGLDQWAALHDGYVTEFGLDAGSAEQSSGPGGGWVVRFARQLTRPAHEVWGLLAGGEAAKPGGPVPVGFRTGVPSDARVTAVEPPHRFEFTWSEGGATRGEVRWALAPGYGGARLDLTEIIAEGSLGQPQRALEAWAETLEKLATRLR